MKLRQPKAFGATAIIGSALVASACSGGEAYPSTTTGGTTGGTQTVSTGGTPSATGGVAPSTGGTIASTGGTLSNTGGTLSTTGGTFGGGRGDGGSAGTGGAGGKAGTGGSAGGTGTVAYPQIVAFIRANCGSCHANSEPPNLNTQNPTTLYSTLTTVTVRQCGNNKLVVPNDPSKSALLMVGTDQCGDLKMPAGCAETVCFEAADVTLLTTWIQQGARNP